MQQHQNSTLHDAGAQSSAVTDSLLQQGPLEASHDGAGLEGGQAASRDHPLQLAAGKGDAVWGGSEVEQAQPILCAQGDQGGHPEAEGLGGRCIGLGTCSMEDL